MSISTVLHYSDRPVHPLYSYIFVLESHCDRVGVNSAPELDFLANSKSNSGIGIELALPSPGGIGIE